MNSALQFSLSWADFLLRRKLKHLIVHVTNHCNFRCGHCFVDFDGAKRDLPTETYRALGADAGSLFWLDIGGGEPFIRKDLAEIIGFFRARVVHIPSNGSLPAQMIEQLRRIRRCRPAGDILIGLSLDGLAYTHDTLRGRPGNYDEVWSAYDAIRSFDRRINIKMTTVISNRTIADILPLMRLVRERGADFHSVILLRGSPPAPDVTLPSLEELRRLGPQISALLKGYTYGQSRVEARILQNYHKFLWRTSLDVLERREQVIPCYAGRSHMVVWGDGNVSACEMLAPVGTLKEQRFQDILHGERFLAQVRSIRNRECHCTHNCAMLTSILFNPANVVRLLAEPRP